MSIKLLDENTINKIAAGEVIENPSNIVKELVENAIDAGAKNIEIYIQDGGNKLIKIIDDGIGFAKEDIALAFLKHATSKLTKVEDLYEIASYGFRGEALSSIAACAKVELITRQKDSKIGFSYKIEYGKKIEFSESASNVGTTIIVKNLFENIPVRKKFLKSNQREAATVEDIVVKFAYIRPDISFKYVSDATIKFNSNGNNDLKTVIYDVYGKDVYDNLLEIDETLRGIKIKGYIARPIVARNNRNDIIYFINNRYVKNTIVTKAIEDAYSEYLMQHKFPMLVLLIEIDSKTVDINVHPKKEEVRFSEDEVVYFAVYNAVYSRLKKSNLIHNESLFEKENDVAKRKNNNEKNEISATDQNEKNYYGKKSIDIDDLPSLLDIIDKKSNTGFKVNNIFEKFDDSNKVVKHFEERTFIEKTLSEDHRYIGQIFNTYILIEFEEKLYIIDQHAAHEKINFEKLMKAYRENSIMSEKVFPSIMIKLTPLQYAAVEKNIEDFKKIGYEIELFGDNDIKVDAVPYDIVNIGKKELLLEMIDGFTMCTRKESYSSIVERIASISCKKAIKAGYILSENEVKNMLRELFKLDNPYNCPHGRPTIISFSKTEFEKKFGRIV